VKLRVTATLLGLLLAGRAFAGTVDITLTRDSANTVELGVHNSLDLDLGAISVLVVHSTGFAFDASNPGLSLADSVYLPNALSASGFSYDALIADNVAGAPLVPAHGDAVIGSFSVPQFSPFPVLIPGELSVHDPGVPGVPAFGWTLYDINLVPLNALAIDAVNCGTAGGCPFAIRVTVPEPSSLSLLVAVALVALVQGARGGKILRRSGSVAKPT
jgi:hypothetical protein